MQAWYGRLVLDASAPGERARVIDVTAPLQCLVRQSKLVVTEASKVLPRNIVVFVHHVKWGRVGQAVMAINT